MPISVIPLNGDSSIIDYNKLKTSLSNFLGDKCNEATLYVFNRFGVPVSSETTLDLLFLLSIHDVRGNFTRYYYENEGKAGFEYFKNVIIPVNIQTGHENAQIRIDKKFIYVNNNEYDSSDEINSLKFGFLNFLQKKCSLENKQLIFEPIQLLINNNYSGIFKNYIIDSKFNSDYFFDIVKNNHAKHFRSNGDWTKDLGYINFKNSAADINDAISDYTSFGYLTKRKIQRIESRLSKDSAIFDSIGKNTTSINGKAGTGKTAHLLHLLTRCLKNDKNVTFLTYNQLLTKDIAYQVKMIQNSLYRIWEAEGRSTSNFSSATVQTLMGFMFKLSKSLGVLHLMTADRVLELEKILVDSINFLINNLPTLFQKYKQEIFANNRNNFNKAIEAIQNTNWPIATKQYGISLVHYIERYGTGLVINLDGQAKNFMSYKLNQIKEMTYKDVFLKDYSGCLKNTLNAIKNTETFYDEFNVRDKFELLDVLMNLGVRKQDEDLVNNKISFNIFKDRVNNVVKGRTTKGRILMVDEAQDCLPYEREIFYNIFQPQNVVISNGGKEQLVRFSEICNWGVYNGRENIVKKVSSGNQSYRIKQAILDFCNFIAARHNIDLNLKFYSPEDTGHLIFDFRPINKLPTNNLFIEMLEKGKVNRCSPLESLMIFDINHKDENQHRKGNQLEQELVNGVVNEYGVLHDQQEAQYSDFPYLKSLSDYCEYWVGAVANKQKLPFPSPNEVRVLNYESCRGLESWCVMCFNIDSFYTAQTQSTNAENFLLHEGAIMSSDQRSAMYAITWILMAATRAIDTLYLQLSNNENPLFKLCQEYAELNASKCTVYKTPEILK